MAALKMAPERIMPPIKAQDMPVTLPSLEDTLPARGEQVLQAAADGKIPPDAAKSLIDMPSAQARLVECEELERRLTSVVKDMRAAKEYTRRTVGKARKRDYFARYGDQARIVLDALLEKYADGGLDELEDTAVLKVPPLNDIGTSVEIVRLFGSKRDFRVALRDMTSQLYT